MSRKSATEVALAISHIFKASLEQVPVLDTYSLPKLLKRSHIYQHPSLETHESLRYDSKYNRLSTYNLVNLPRKFSDRIISRKFVNDTTVIPSLVKRSVDSPETLNWLNDCRSLVKRDFQDADHDAVAGDEKNLWSLWKSKAGEYIAVFKNGLGSFSSLLIRKVSQVWDFVNRLLVRIRIKFEVNLL